MREIGLDSKKWTWKPNDIESVCFQLVNNEELISSTTNSVVANSVLHDGLDSVHEEDSLDSLDQATSKPKLLN